MSSGTEDPNRPAVIRTGPLAPESHSGKCKEELYLEMAKLSQQSFQNRQSYEWKIAFGLWTGIGLFTYFATEHAGAISGPGLLCLAAAYFVLGGVWCLLWQPALHGANRQDKRWKHYYLHRAENRAQDRSARDPWRDESAIRCSRRVTEHFAELGHPWAWVQGTATLVFLAVSFVIIQANSNRVPARVGKDVISISGDNATKVVDKLTE